MLVTHASLCSQTKTGKLVGASSERNKLVLTHFTVKMHPAVCDGDTIGHPLCRVHDCKIPLSSHNHRFCPDHDHLNKKCAVTECLNGCAVGFHTCDEEEHRALEKAYFKKGKGIFQLRAQLKKAGVAVLVDSVPLEDIHESDSEDDEALGCNGKHEGGNRRLRAYFGRRRTHNEQLIMRPCGVILSRATFFGSEAISVVHVREQV